MNYKLKNMNNLLGEILTESESLANATGLIKDPFFKELLERAKEHHLAVLNRKKEEFEKEIAERNSKINNSKGYILTITRKNTIGLEEIEIEDYSWAMKIYGKYKEEGHLLGLKTLRLWTACETKIVGTKFTY